MQIVAATDFSTRSNRALRQAGLLAQEENSRLHIVHVVDDDQPKELIRMETHEAERLLTEQIDSMPELRGIDCRPVITAGDPFDGIIRTAAEVSADLVVMGTHRKQLLLDIFVGTTIERVIRKGAFPVLMVNNEAQRKYRNVVAPFDMSETSANALRTALSTGLIVDGGATLLHAFLAPTAGKMFAVGSERPKIHDYLAGERQLAMDELAAFLVAKDFGSGRWSLRVEDGLPMEVISRAVSEMHPDLLIMGTHGHSALVKALISSVTEEALRSLSVDILAVPPSKQ
jgi:nucleotide-binding universal stress UspA family protein